MGIQDYEIATSGEVGGVPPPLTNNSPPAASSEGMFIYEVGGEGVPPAVRGGEGPVSMYRWDLGRRGGGPPLPG